METKKNQKTDLENKKSIDVITIVDNMTEILSNMHLFNSEANGKTNINVMAIVPNVKDEDVVVVREVDAALDKEAVRVIENMPRWKPCKQRGNPVRVSFSVSVNFVLQ